MGKPAYLVYDNLQDRMEMVYLLGRLPPFQRVAFLELCCTHSRVGHTDLCPGVLQETYDRAEYAMRDDSADEKLTLELWGDLIALFPQYSLDPDKVLGPLVEMARQIKNTNRQGVRRIMASSGFKGVANGRRHSRAGAHAAPLLTNLAGSGSLLVADLTVPRPTSGTSALKIELD